MQPVRKRWNFLPAAPADHLLDLSHLNSIVVQVLFNRQVTDRDDVQAFVSGRLVKGDPFSMRGMEAAVERILAAICGGERIVVFGDYDADGVTATALLIQALRAAGARHVEQEIEGNDPEDFYIPHRQDEGYGLNRRALEKIAASGARLVITVDCGIRSVEEVAYARTLGLDVIVTDHHSVGPVLPPALAVLNPKQDGCNYPYKYLSGAGVAFKLAQALIEARAHGFRVEREIGLLETDLLDLVALGTVADVVPLKGENRVLVQQGLEILNQARRPGIAALLREAGIKPGKVDAAAIAYALGPRLNAAGRLKSARLSYNLLAALNLPAAAEVASELGRLNRQRQDLTKEMLAVARDQIEAREEAHLYLVTHSDFNPGIVGLVASRLVEEYQRPILVAHIDEQFVRGSARSIPGFDITAALAECEDLLLRYGGHSLAAGFAAETQKLPDLRGRLEDIAARELDGKDLTPSLDIDAVVPCHELQWDTYAWLAKLEPFGHENPQPLLATLGLQVVDCKTVGSDGRHLKLAVRDPLAASSGQAAVQDAIAFGLADWLGPVRRNGPLIDLAYTFEVNEFNGQRRLQLNVKDIRLNEAAS